MRLSFSQLEYALRHFSLLKRTRTMRGFCYLFPSLLPLQECKEFGICFFFFFFFEMRPSVGISTHIYTHIYIYVYIYVCMSVCMYLCIYACMNACMRVRMLRGSETGTVSIAFRACDYMAFFQ